MPAKKTAPDFADCLVPHSPKQSFLSKVDEVIDWKPIEKQLKKQYWRTQNAIGNAAYPALPMFKALLLQRWYELSDAALEESLYDRVSFIRFCGFQMSGPRPDETTICRFRSALREVKLYERLFKTLNQQLEAGGLLVKSGAIVDATLVESQRRPTKIIEVEPEDEDDVDQATAQARVFYSDDTEANWTVKMGRPHYDYKRHMAVDSRNGFILGGHVTSASRSDMNELESTLEDADLKAGTLVMADKGYCSRANRERLSRLGHYDGIMHKTARGRALDPEQKEFNRTISKLRYQVERAFGTLKRDYGFRRARYLGQAKLEVEFFLNAFCFNVKKAVRLVS